MRRAPALLACAAGFFAAPCAARAADQPAGTVHLHSGEVAGIDLPGRVLTVREPARPFRDLEVSVAAAEAGGAISSAGGRRSWRTCRAGRTCA